MKKQIIIFSSLLILTIFIIFFISQKNKNFSFNELQIEELNLSTSDNCKMEKYETNEYNSLSEYFSCNYTVNELKDTWIFVEIKKFENREDLENTYQYESSHLFGSKGLLSENELGEKSRFRVSSDDDYGAEFNPKGVYFYHLWICKGNYLIHITSKGEKEAGEYVKKIGQKIISNI
ncbi:MAG: hypothetical protein QXO84_02800 [Candidatus Aenigmatarchaeota archaeon]